MAKTSRISVQDQMKDGRIIGAAGNDVVRSATTKNTSGASSCTLVASSSTDGDSFYASGVTLKKTAGS